MLVGVWRGQESGAEIALIAVHAAEWGYKEDSVQDVLEESSSSGLVVSVTPATGTNRGLTKVQHGRHLPFLAGSNIIHRDLEKTTSEP